MRELILNKLKQLRTDYGNNENIIFANDSDLEVVADELLQVLIPELQKENGKSWEEGANYVYNNCIP